MSGASGSRTWMLLLCGHPLALLTGRQHEAATHTRICTFRQTKENLELPLLRRRKTPLEVDWHQTELPNKGSRMDRGCEPYRFRKTRPKGDTVTDVIARYEAERMPSRHSTARVYRSFFANQFNRSGGTHSYEICCPARWNFGFAIFRYLQNPRRMFAVCFMVWWNMLCGQGHWR